MRSYISVIIKHLTIPIQHIPSFKDSFNKCLKVLFKTDSFALADLVLLPANTVMSICWAVSKLTGLNREHEPTYGVPAVLDNYS